MRHPRPEPRGGPAGERNDDVGSPGAVDQLVEAVDAAEDGDRVGLRVNGELPVAVAVTSEPSRAGGVSGVDEADDG
jgi:hypothetical protein